MKQTKSGNSVEYQTAAQNPIQKKSSIQANQRPVQRVHKASIQTKQRPVNKSNPDSQTIDPFHIKSPAEQVPIQQKPNNTGLPDGLKSGIEHLSGMDISDVKVHYNSDKPAQLQAHAYAQGIDIHVASGQEHHLPHEAWHVVQQKQGRVKPTMQMKGKVNINDDTGLEKEADVMGEKALQPGFSDKPAVYPQGLHTTSNSPIQRVIYHKDKSEQYPDAKSAITDLISLINATSWRETLLPIIQENSFNNILEALHEKAEKFEILSIAYALNEIKNINNQQLNNIITQFQKNISAYEENDEKKAPQTESRQSNLANNKKQAIATVLSNQSMSNELKPNDAYKLKDDLCNALGVANKAHKPHGSNFSKKITVKNIIKDWLKSLNNDIREDVEIHLQNEHKYS